MKDLHLLTAGELLRVALDEAKTYPIGKLCMHDWVNFTDGVPCGGCLAGVVLLSRHVVVDQSHVGRIVDNDAVYTSIDDMRCGFIPRRFIDTDVKRVAVYSILGERLRIAAHNNRNDPWVNHWKAHEDLSNWLIEHNI